MSRTRHAKAPLRVRNPFTLQNVPMLNQAKLSYNQQARPYEIRVRVRVRVALALGSNLAGERIYMAYDEPTDRRSQEVVKDGETPCRSLLVSVSITRVRNWHANLPEYGI